MVGKVTNEGDVPGLALVELQLLFHVFLHCVHELQVLRQRLQLQQDQGKP